jgi:hypothetical protein
MPTSQDRACRLTPGMICTTHEQRSTSATVSLRKGCHDFAAGFQIHRAALQPGCPWAVDTLVAELTLSIWLIEEDVPGSV